MLANKQRCEIVKNNTTETVVKLETLAMISRYNQFFLFLDWESEKVGNVGMPGVIVNIQDSFRLISSSVIVG